MAEMTVHGYGVWNTVTKEFQFGICAKTKAQAQKELENKIGHDAKKYRFEIRKVVTRG